MKETSTRRDDEEPKALESKVENGAAEKEEPTKVRQHRGWKAMPYVIGNETFEKLGTIGTSANLLVYLTTVFHMTSVSATTLLNVFTGTTNLTPLMGAFLSDTYFGRYATLGFASVASFTGMLMLTLTSGISKLHPPQCDANQPCAGPTALQLSFLFLAFAFLIVGAGGIRPCNLAFGADQFDPATESGRRGINSFFNWYYFTFTFAMMLSSTVIIYVQSNISWTLGLAIPTLLMFFSCTFFFVGSRIYVKVKPQGSPFSSVAQVLVAALRKLRLEAPAEPQGELFNPYDAKALNCRLPYSPQFRCLDKAAIPTSKDEIKPNGSAANPWRLCSMQQVEEVKCIIRIIPVWSTGILFYVAMLQQSNYVVFQVLQCDRHLGTSGFQIPAASFVVFSMIALTAWIPIYDRIIVPRLQKLTGKVGGITMLQRMGIGIVLSIGSMIISGFVEQLRRNYALNRPTIGTATGGGAISSFSSLWLIPQLMLLGLAEAFNIIAQIEFYYKQFPENMKSAAGSLFFLGAALSNYLSGFMVTVINQTTGGNGRKSWLDGDLNKGRLDYYYFLIVALGVGNFIYFIVCARWYRYRDEATGAEASLELEPTTKSKAPPV